jgi:hypothetical protein
LPFKLGQRRSSMLMSTAYPGVLGSNI